MLNSNNLRLAGITETEKIEIKSESVPHWFEKYVLEKAKKDDYGK